LLGLLDLAYERMALSDDGERSFLACLAEPGSPTAERLAVLAGWTATAAASAQIRNPRQASRMTSDLHDADRAGVEVAVDGFGAAFRAVAGVLHAAEGHLGRGHRGHVDPQHADFDAARELVGGGE
jgi:hypothetical protein